MVDERGPEAVARRYFEAAAARDQEQMAACWSPEGVDDITSIGILRGPDEVRAYFQAVFAALPDNELVVERVIAEERVAAVQWRSRGTFSGAPLLGVEPTGRLLLQRGCDCLEVEDGLIVRNTAYLDGLMLARGVGLLPPQDSASEKLMLGARNLQRRLGALLSQRARH